MDVCTIIAKNYVAHARVLARSFAAHHPGGRFYVLVIDEIGDHLRPSEEPFTTLTPRDVGVDCFETMSALYNVLELATAVKPWLLRWVAAHGESGVAVYLDPDMRIYEPLEDVFARVQEHELVLSPHNLDPMPRDGLRPTEQDILVAGAYNLGFMGIKAGEFADRLLDWWSERLETDCVVDPARGFFVDQRWIDLVPGMAPNFHLLRDPGFNVAYWNLHSRPIRRTAEDIWMAGDVPLRLFHFSGFDHERPNVLSKHQNRVRIQDHPDLAGLCLSYAEELQAEGVEEALSWAYDYAATPGGLELTPDIRRAYRELLVDGRLGRSPYTPEGEAELIEALNEPAGARAGGEFGVTRYLASLHSHHAHLSRAFPDLADVDGPRLVEWAHKHSRGEIPPALLRPTPPPGDEPTPPPAARVSSDRPFGVNVAGYLNAELGVGEIARQAITALDTALVPVLPMALAAPGSRHSHPFAHTGRWSGGYPINLVCVNADVLPDFAQQAGPAFFQGRHTIGWWWWELAEFPKRWLGSFELVDQLWAGSTFVAETLARVADIPVTVVPAPVTVEGAPRSEPERFRLPPEFSFLFTYDYSSVLARKNPLGLIDAFLRAFPEPGEACLVLKSINADHHPAHHARVREAAQEHRHVLIFDDYLHPVDKDRLVASCDCYVSLHRSEGFGMTMAEAMYLGKPVIATGYSGNTDFMRPDNSWLVKYKLAAVGPGAAPYPPEAHWAEPDLAHAASLMREVFEGGDSVRQRARKGASDIRRRHSPDAVGQKMESLLREAANHLPRPRGGWEDPQARRSSRAAANLVEAGAQAAAPQRRGPRRALRDTVLRLIKPYTAHQAQIDQALIDSVVQMTDAVRELNERSIAVEALGLQGLRNAERRMRTQFEANLKTDAERLDAVEQRLDPGRLDVDAPHLSAGSARAMEPSVQRSARGLCQPGPRGQRATGGAR